MDEQEFKRIALVEGSGSSGSQMHMGGPSIALGLPQKVSGWTAGHDQDSRRSSGRKIKSWTQDQESRIQDT